MMDSGSIEKIIMQWRGINGGVYAIHGCALEIAAAVDATPASATALARAVLDLNIGWNAEEPERLIADRIDLARRLANVVLAKSNERSQSITGKNNNDG